MVQRVTAPSGGAPLPASHGRESRICISFPFILSRMANGRIGRAIAEKALAQSLGQPTLTALAATILVRRKAYYAALEAANKSNDVTAWPFLVRRHSDRSTAAHDRAVDFLIDKTRLLDRLRGQLNERQEKALLRMLREGPEGFRGGLERRQLYQHHRGITGDGHTRSHGYGREGRLDASRRTPPCPLSRRIPLRFIAPVVLDDSGEPDSAT